MIEYVRPTIKDIPKIQTLLDEVWKATYGPFYPSEKLKKLAAVFHNTERLTEQINNTDICFIVAKIKDNEIVGVITAYQKNENIDAGRLYIQTDFQGKGIGSDLLKQAISYYPSAKIIQVGVDIKNDVGRTWYMKKGFKAIEEASEKPIGEETITTFIMEKKIEQKDRLP